MKIWIIPLKTDYHERAELLVKAETKEEAIEKAIKFGLTTVEKEMKEFKDSENRKEQIKKYVEENNRDWERDVRYNSNEIEEWEDDVYSNVGCDC